jgi:predicted amidophosphoribosyltransferase
MRCPHCNGKVDRIDKFCRNCGRSVVGVEDTEPSAESAAAPLTRALASSGDDSQTWGARLNAYGSTYGS